MWIIFNNYVDVLMAHLDTLEAPADAFIKIMEEDLQAGDVAKDFMKA